MILFFVVGFGVVLLMGRNGMIIYFLVEYFSISKNWFYGFNGILLLYIFVFILMVFMIIEGVLWFIFVNLEEVSYSFKSLVS